MGWNKFTVTYNSSYELLQIFGELIKSKNIHGIFKVSLKTVEIDRRFYEWWKIMKLV